MAYFVVSDSIRGELKRLAFANPRSLRDVMYLKLNTATARKKIEKSDVYKEALISMTSSISKILIQT